MEETKRIAAADLVMGVLLVIFGGYLIESSLKMKVYRTFLDAPGFFPLLLGCIFIILGGMMTFTAIKRRGFHHLKRTFSGETFGALFRNAKFKRVMVLTGLMVVYIFGLIGRIHFTIATVIYLFLTFLFLKSTSIIKITIISVVTSLAISSLFTRVFHIPLP